MTRKQALPYLSYCLSLSTALIATVAHAKQNNWNSVYTDLTKDCVTISRATNKAEIDFADQECKAFGGYQLNIAGGDVRYAPKLKYHGENINLHNPGAFHDMGSNKVEWIYFSTMDEAGQGSLKWVGWIYRLSVSRPNGTESDSILYAVRLDGENSCALGTAQTNEQARRLVYNSKPNCQ
jgi:hypothetical protein